MCKKIFFYSMSCEVSPVNMGNISEIVNNKSDYSLTADIREADAVIFDGCISTGDAFLHMENVCIELLNNTNQTAPIYVIGCGNKATADMVPSLNNPRIKVLTGDWSKKLVEAINSKHEWSLSSFAEVCDDFILLRIQEGCLKRCSFCKTNVAQFPLKSVKLEEIQMLLERLHTIPQEAWPSRQINIVGQNPTEYGIEIYRERKLHEIIDMIEKCSIIDTTFIRHLNAAEFYPKLIEALKSSTKVKVVEMHLETASNRLLKLMKRGYTKEQFAEIVKELRGGNNPDILITTDVIAGYPSETEDDVAETIDFLRENKIQLNYVYPYVDSLYLPNQDLKRIPKEVMKRRILRYEFHKTAQQKNL